MKKLVDEVAATTAVPKKILRLHRSKQPCIGTIARLRLPECLYLFFAVRRYTQYTSYSYYVAEMNYPCFDFATKP